jgi:hypothetical protein
MHYINRMVKNGHGQLEVHEAHKARDCYLGFLAGKKGVLLSFSATISTT